MDLVAEGKTCNLGVQEKEKLEAIYQTAMAVTLQLPQDYVTVETSCYKERRRRLAQQGDLVVKITVNAPSIKAVEEVQDTTKDEEVFITTLAKNLNNEGIQQKATELAITVQEVTIFTGSPTKTPTKAPTSSPTKAPTRSGATYAPSKTPTPSPTASPTTTTTPTASPTKAAVLTLPKPSTPQNDSTASQLKSTAAKTKPGVEQPQDGNSGGGGSSDKDATIAGSVVGSLALVFCGIVAATVLRQKKKQNDQDRPVTLDGVSSQLEIASGDFNGVVTGGHKFARVYSPPVTV